MKDAVLTPNFSQVWFRTVVKAIFIFVTEGGRPLDQGFEADENSNGRAPCHSATVTRGSFAGLRIDSCWGRASNHALNMIKCRRHAAPILPRA